MTTTRSRLLLGLAGVCLAAYPLLRPYGSEAGLDGARLYAEPLWLVSHVLAMVGFVLVAVAARDLWPRTGTIAAAAAFLLLPYYGAEAFGLHALGRAVVESGEAGAMEAADGFRYEAIALTTFGIGWVVLAVAGVLIARAAWAVGGPVRVAGLAAGAMLAVYLLQFFGPSEVRMAHGVVLGLGLVGLAVTWPARRAATRTTAVDRPVAH